MLSFIEAVVYIAGSFDRYRRHFGATVCLFFGEIMKQEYKVIIIGSGFGGMTAALNLRKEGVDDFLILERREFMGGTWSQNVYPGAAVDVPSILYSLQPEPYAWTQKYAEQEELNSYTNHVISKNNLAEKTLTNTTVSKIKWDEKLNIWQIYIEGKASLSCQFLINATGPLSTPVIPEFKGKDLFKGKSFHTNNWDGSYDHAGKRVAIIGSGASAAQVIPAIADKVKHLSIFQRTPHWVMPRNDWRFSAWQKKLLKSKLIYKFVRALIYWSLEYRVVGFKYSQGMLNLIGKNAAQKLIKKHIGDPKMQQQVTPNFSFGCKRVILSDTLYPAYCRENVTLFDKNNGVKEITEKGIITQDGTEHELDLIVYSTGYDATDGVISYPVEGKDGITLRKVWEDFPRAYLGTTAPNFPNLFVVTGPNTGIGHTSALFLIESQMAYIMRSIREVTEKGASNIEVKADAEERYTALIHREMTKTVWQSGGCDSWYKSKSGKVIAMFPGFSFTYRRWAKKFKTADHIIDG